MSAESGIHSVRIALSRGTVELPLASRDALIEQFEPVYSMRPIRETFEAIGTSRPVELTRDQKVALLSVIEVWGAESEGGLAHGLPPGIFEFREALLDDLHDSRPLSG